MKKTILPLLIFTFICTANFAQDFNENFNDGSFTDGPVWSGNTDDFTINAGQLELAASAAGNSYLSTPVSTGGETVWEFYFSMDFNPSGNNNLQVFLNSSNADLTGTGYFLQIGESGSDNADALELLKTDGNSTQVVLRGTDGTVASDPASRVQVTRDAAGNWEILADHTGGTNFVSEGTANDNTYLAGNFFGFRCKYTSGNIEDAFFFDDITIDPIVIAPPEIQEIIPISNTALDVYFSEPVALPSAGSPANYSVSGIGSPANAQLDGTDATLVHLTGFSQPFSNGQTYTLTATGVEDLTGDASDDSETFTFFIPDEVAPFDILINEFMAKKNTNGIGFQNSEYVELYNRSNKLIDLSDIQYTDGSSPVTLPTYVMTPGEYVILTKADFFSFFSGTALFDINVSLTDGGDDIHIQDLSGTTIHRKIYVENEIAAGISTELVNPESFCTSDNWQLSLSPAGGTPGAENSVFNSAPDMTPPTPTCAKIENSNTVILFFDELIDITSAENPTNYTVNNNIGTPSNVILNEEGNTVILNFDNTFNEGVFYEITINNILDCTLGNVMTDAITVSFILPENIEPFDLLINEFMAEPSNDLGGLQSVEYVEFYNRSSKYILLEQLRFSHDGGDNFKPLPQCALLAPAEYAVLTSPGNESLFAGNNVYGFSIALTNEGDDMWLQDLNGQTIHRKGFGPDEVATAISTELINPESYCSSANWAISTDPLGGTPGRENTQYNSSPDQSAPELVCVNVEDDNTLQLVFNEILDATSARDELNYDVNNIGSPTSAFTTGIGDEVLLNFGVSFTEDIIQEISVTGVYDCTGNNIIGTENTAQFSFSNVNTGDLVINEILYDAPTGGKDFIEIYNNSEKILPINGLSILEQQEDSFYTANIEVRCPLQIGEYIAFSADPRDTRTNYPLTPNPEGIHFANLPAFDDGSIISILGAEQLFGRDTIDKFAVDKNYHNPLIDITKGVSLERIDFDAPTQDRNNWQSAAESAGWATPAYENSQRYTGTGGSSNDCVTITEEIFSPDGDGYRDFLRIDYDLDTPGYIANVRIFDARGRQIKQLTNNQFLEPQGFFRWNGDTDEGLKARLGIYIVWVELFDVNGNVTRCKNTCVVAGQL